MWKKTFLYVNLEIGHFCIVLLLRVTRTATVAERSQSYIVVWNSALQHAGDVYSRCGNFCAFTCLQYGFNLIARLWFKRGKSFWVLLERNFLFTFSDTFAVGCVV